MFLTTFHCYRSIAPDSPHQHPLCTACVGENNLLELVYPYGSHYSVYHYVLLFTKLDSKSLKSLLLCSKRVTPRRGCFRQATGTCRYILMCW